MVGVRPPEQVDEVRQCIDLRVRVAAGKGDRLIVQCLEVSHCRLNHLLFELVNVWLGLLRMLCVRVGLDLFSGVACALLLLVEVVDGRFLRLRILAFGLLFLP